MRLGVIAENPLERIALAAGLMPVPLGETMIALLLARSIVTGTELGVFEALKDGPLPANEVAKRCGTDAAASEKLLFALAGARYLRFKAGQYSLMPVARKWLLRDSPHSLRDATLQRDLDLELMGHATKYVRSGQPVDFHEKMTPEQWDIYQRGQRSHAVYAAPEIAKRTPTPPDPKTMLDVGGAHGYYSVELCRRHHNLRSTILDLPGAVAQSAPRIAQEDVGERISYRAGDALTEELGSEKYDLVFIANLVHHFNGEQNRALMKRVARSLRPGGTCVILEIIRAATPREAGQIGALLDFYFAITSASGTWSSAEMAGWQREAGLQALKPIRPRFSPGYGIQAARKA